MATSDSDDFESADEELAVRNTPSKKVSTQWQNKNSVIDSESDDDNECMQPAGKSSGWNSGNRSIQSSGQERTSRTSVSSIESTSAESTTKIVPKDKAKGTPKDAATKTNVETQKKVSQATKKSNKDPINVNDCTEELNDLSLAVEISKSEAAAAVSSESAKSGTAKKISSIGLKATDSLDTSSAKKNKEHSDDKSNSDAPAGKKDRPQRQRKPKESKNLGVKKFGSKVEAAKPPVMEARTPDEIRKQAIAEGKEPPLIEECWEFNEEETAKILKGMKDFGLGEGKKVKMPEELKSEKKFKEIFKPDGWEDLDDEEILAELDDKKSLPVGDKVAETREEASNSGWGWGSWGVSSFINSATAGVSTLTSHVTHGLELLDQAVGAPHPEDLAKTDQPDDTDSIEEKSSSNPEVQSQLSFGFNDLISGVSSITKLVESTGTKVITGGLGTLESIGKKTMEVLQEGDPGLKKKRAFFLNDNDKPILSQMLREAKEKADVEEKTLEEKQLTRKVHFESLFDDFQGLVHLEALEMLSKQCNIKIQQRLVTLDSDELTSIQETLEEVKELCDLGDEDEEEESEENLQERLKSACKDLGVAITYEKLQDIWKDTRTYLTEVSTLESTATEREVFQRAISTLARFTAFSVERFHKTAELLLIKERRSTVNEADALVQLTRILSGQIGIAANLFSNWLNERKKKTDKPDTKVDITTIFLEAANASSYIQDAFRLLIPILQVGAI